jgi:hypothetical protein
MKLRSKCGAAERSRGKESVSGGDNRHRRQLKPIYAELCHWIRSGTAVRSVINRARQATVAWRRSAWYLVLEGKLPQAGGGLKQVPRIHSRSLVPRRSGITWTLGRALRARSKSSLVTPPQGENSGRLLLNGVVCQQISTINICTVYNAAAQLRVELAPPTC